MIRVVIFVCCLITAEKGSEILREVRNAQEAFRKQKDLHKLEAEVGINGLVQYLIMW